MALVPSCRLNQLGLEAYVVEPSPTMLAAARRNVGEYRAQVGTYGSLGLVLGWCIAGRALLSFFWPKARIPALLRVRQR